MIYLIFPLISVFFTPASSDTQASKACLNAEEEKLIHLINEYRKSRKLKPIHASAKLTRVAKAHVRDLADHYTFDPDNPCNPHSWSESGPWTSCCYTNDHKQAECMWNKPREIAGYQAHGYEIAYYSSRGATAEEGIKGWKKSSAHNPLLVNTGIWRSVEWKAIGVGIYDKFAVVWFGQLEDPSRPARCH